MSKEEDAKEIEGAFKSLTITAQAILGYVTICCLQSEFGTVDLADVRHVFSISTGEWEAALRELYADHRLTRNATPRSTLVIAEPAMIMNTRAYAPTNRPKQKDWDRLRRQVFAASFGDGEPYCEYCRATGVQLVLDHATPLARGGSNHFNNLVPACVPCNSAKGALTYAEFVERGWR